MKKIFKLVYVFILMIILLTTNDVMAFTTTLSGTKNIDANTSFTVTMNLSGATDLIALDAVLSYDSNKLELTNSKGQDGWQTTVASKIVGANSNGLNGNGSIVSLTFKAKSEFVAGESTTISVTNVKGSNSNVERQTGNDASITVSVNIPKSTNNNLSSLSVDGKSVNGFSSDNVSYDLGEFTGNSLNISATVEDSKASVSGTGSKNINYGKNTFNVIVTAENGNKKTYTITVTKPDNRSKDNTLASLSASPLDLKFNKNTTSYSFNVEHKVNSITINAKATDSKASVSGTGSKTLKDYVNTFSIVVTAENGSTKTYTIRVIRKDADGNLGSVSKDNTLKSLTVDGYDIKFNKDTLEYGIEVDNLVDNIKVSAVVNHSSATYEVVGNTDLSVGTNAVKINVTAESGDVKTYIINVNRKSDSPTATLKDLESVLSKATSKEVIVEIKDGNTILDSNIIKLIKESKKKIIINNYSGNFINYSWVFDGSEIDDIDSIDTSIKFSSDNISEINKLTNYADSIYLNFVHDGELPSGTKIRIYVADRYDNYDRVNIYYYNQDKNKMDIVQANIEVLDGYVEFELEHCSEFIITRATLNSESFNWFMVISIIEFIVIVGYVLYVTVLNGNKKRK